MPKIKSYTPAWLLPPTPGHDLFAPDPSDTQNGSPYTFKSFSKSVPRRTLARRGTEVFIAVGKEIRWADLVYLKERWEEKQAKARSGSRVKREDSVSPSDDELLRESIESGCAEGFRVSGFASYLLLVSVTKLPRLSQPPLAAKSYSSLYHLTQTS